MITPNGGSKMTKTKKLGLCYLCAKNGINKEAEFRCVECERPICEEHSYHNHETGANLCKNKSRTCAKKLRKRDEGGAN